MSHPPESHPAERQVTSLPPLQGSSYRYAVPPTGPYHHGLLQNHASARTHPDEHSSSSFCDEHGGIISESFIRVPTNHVAPDHSNFTQFVPWTPYVAHPPLLTCVIRDSCAQSTHTNELQQAHASPPGPTVPDLSSLLSPLNTLQASISGVQTDVQNVLKELRTIKNTQKNLVNRVDSLEEVLGVCHKKARQKQKRAKGSRGNVNDETSDQVGVPEEGSLSSRPPVASFFDKLGAIEIAVEKLLDRTESTCCKRSIHCHAATPPPPSSFPLDTTVADAAHSIPAKVIPLQMPPASETPSCPSIPAYTFTTATQSSVKYASVQVCDSPSARPSPAHGEQCHFSFVPAIWSPESGSVSSVQGSDGSVDRTGSQSLPHNSACPSGGLHVADEVASASAMSSESLVFPLLSLQQPSPLASIPAVAKSTLSSAPSSMRTNSDSHSPLDSGSQSTLVDIAPATKEVIVSVGSPVPPSVPGPGALAGASPTVHVTTSVLPSVFHRSSVNHSCNQEADDGILTDTSVQSCGHPNRLQLPSLPFNPSAPCDTLPAGSRQVASSASTTPLATQLLSTKAGSMQGSINATNPSVCPVDSQTDGEGMNIESSGLNLTPFIPAPPTETALGVSMQRTTGVDSCGVSRSSDVFMEEEGPAGAAQGGDESRNVHGNHGAGMSTSEPRGVSESRHNDQSEASVDIVSSHQSLLSSTDRQHMQEEDVLLQALVPTPATAMTSPASVPSLILPSTTVSRCSSVAPHDGTITDILQAEKLQVPFVLPASDPAPNPADGKLSSSTSPSPTSSIRTPLSIPSFPLTSLTTGGELSDPENLHNDAPLATHIAKPSRDLTKVSSRKCGGPTASLSELMKLARRESQSTQVNNMKVSKEKKRKRASLEGVQEAHVTNSAHSSLSQPVLEPGIEADIMNTSGVEGPRACDSGPGGSATSRAEHNKELISHRADPLKIIIPARKRVRTGESPATGLEASKVWVEDAYQGTSSHDDCNRDVRARHVVLGGKVVRMDHDLSRDSGGFDLKPSVSVEYHSRGESGREKGKQKSTIHAKGAPSRLPLKQPDMIAAAALPDTSSHQRTVILQTWPELKQSSSSWERQLIQCDNCDMWYHYGCVGVEKHDPRLDSEAAFICPLCFVQIARRLTLRNRTDTCARPDCPHAADAEDDLYFIERLVGRESVGQAGYRWLAKWDGYPMSEASWIPEGNVTGEVDNLLKQFEQDALREGIDLSDKVIILDEAAAVGWTC